jgi:GNAT superfamily N-acetyltransferase
MNAQLRLTINDQEKAAIVAFLAASPHAHIWQHPDSLPIYIRDGRIAYHFIAEEGNQVVAYGIFYVERNKLEAFCLRGPVLDSVEVGKSCINLLREKFRKLGIGQLRLSPYWVGSEAHALVNVFAECNFRPYLRSGPYMKSGRVCLQGTLEEVCQRFSKHTRKEIGRCSRAGFEFLQIRDHERAIQAHSLVQDLKRRKALSPMPLSEFEELYARILCKEESGALFSAYIADRFVGTRWLAKLNRRVAIGVGYAIDNHYMRSSWRSLSLGVPLWVEGMKWARERGCEWFDLEGYDETTPEASPLYGVHQFKGQFKPQPVEIATEHVIGCFWPRYCSYKASRNWEKLVNLPRKILAGRLRIGS